MLEPHRTTALIVIDVQKGEVLDGAHGIPHMPGGEDRHERTRRIVAAARAAGVPPIFIQEVHKRSLIDFGRELDGTERIHCLGGSSQAAHDAALAAMRYLQRDCLVTSEQVLAGLAVASGSAGSGVAA